MRILLSLVAVFIGMASHAAPIPPPFRQSEQFTVTDARPITVHSRGPFKAKSGADLVKLDVDVLLLSAQRIRGTLLWELGLSADKAGRIRMLLYPAAGADGLINVISSLSSEGWEYCVEIPDQIEGQQLVRGVVHAVLLELANRNQGPKSAELPLWLVEGLTAHLRAVAGPDLVVGSVPLGLMLRIVRERQGLDYLQSAREVLRTNRALSFSELAHPRVETLTGESLKVYQSSAQLFVYELLHSRGGASNLVVTLRQLPNCWNWEVALLRGFANQFQRMLDVEKKWSVDVLAFTARDPSQVWSRVIFLDRLDGVLSVPAQVRVAADTLPQRKTMTVQQVISTCDFGPQAAVLQQKLSLLQVLRFNAPPELVPLIDSYFRTLAVYLQKRTLASRTPETRMHPTPSSSLLTQETIKDLELLDKRREDLRPEKALSVNSSITH